MVAFPQLDGIGDCAVAGHFNFNCVIEFKKAFFTPFFYPPLRPTLSLSFQIFGEKLKKSFQYFSPCMQQWI